RRGRVDSRARRRREAVERRSCAGSRAARRSPGRLRAKRARACALPTARPWGGQDGGDGRGARRARCLRASQPPPAIGKRGGGRREGGKRKAYRPRRGKREKPRAALARSELPRGQAVEDGKGRQQAVCLREGRGWGSRDRWGCGGGD